MKKIICFFLSLSIIFAQQLQNPCEDNNYLELKDKNISEMSESEYEYFSLMTKNCQEFQIILLSDSLKQTKKITEMSSVHSSETMASNRTYLWLGIVFAGLMMWVMAGAMD